MVLKIMCRQQSVFTWGPGVVIQYWKASMQRLMYKHIIYKHIGYSIYSIYMFSCYKFRLRLCIYNHTL